MFNEEKKRYKLYKSGKIWVAAPILFLGVTLGTTSVAKADQVQSHSISQPTSIQQKRISSVSTNNQKTPLFFHQRQQVLVHRLVILQVKLKTNLAQVRNIKQL